MKNPKPLYFLLISLLLINGSLLAGCGSMAAFGAPPTPTAVPSAEKSAAIIVEGRIVPRDWANLFFSVSGKVEEILVSEGDRVTSGQTLARLGDRETFDANLAAAQFEFINAQQALDDLQETASLASAQAASQALQAERDLIEANAALALVDTSDFQDRLDDARVAANDAEQELQDAQEEFDKYADADADNSDRIRAKDDLEAAQDTYDEAVRERERLINTLEQAKANVETAQARLEDAQRTRDARASGPDPKDLELATARAALAEAQVAAAVANLRKLDLTAPFDGVIVKVDIAVGEYGAPNQVVMILADFSTLFVETTDLTENEVVGITVGQSAGITPDALPDLRVNATVETISEGYTEKAGDILYKARLILDKSDVKLWWGMTVEVEFGSKP